jgi:signal transduction histidine kinase
VQVAGEGEAQADREKLRRALLNLARNAVEASPDNGVVVLSGRRGGADDGGGALLEVLDRGPGLDEAARERLFRPFFTTKAQGTGLGLALAKKVADAHGGTLSLLPRQGGGTLARLTVPER